MEPLTHKPKTNHPEWNESYYFCFADTKNNIRGMSRMGFKPNKHEGMTFLFLFLPDSSAVGYHAINEIKDYSNPFSIGEITHEYLYDETWKYSFSGNMVSVNKPEDFLKVKKHPELIKEFISVKMNILFRPINKIYEYSQFMTQESLELGKKSGDEHWEQIAELSGEISIGKQVYHLKDVMGQRDHTHGVRDWTGVGNWLYYVVWFNKNLAVNPAAIIADNGDISTGGFIFKNGENIPLKTLKIIDQKFHEDGIFPISSKIELIDWNGEKYILVGEVGPIIPIPFEDEKGKRSILIQSFGTFKLNEIEGGYGTFETLRKAKS